MNRLLKHVASRKGFTLIEIIVTLIMIGITAAIMFPAMGTNLIRSPESVTRVNDQYVLIQEMDKITGQYREEIKNNNLDISNFKSNYVDTNPYVDAVNTGFVTSFNSGTYTPQATDKILKVTLINGDQTLVALFAQ
jgi:prepilin-type N-terminal cleavage/methylation domain-containing protein